MFALSVYSLVSKTPTDYHDALFLHSLTGNGPLQEDSGSNPSRTSLACLHYENPGTGFCGGLFLPRPQQVYLLVATKAVQGV